MAMMVKSWLRLWMVRLIVNLNTDPMEQLKDPNGKMNVPIKWT
jgi:hypothetical protein